MTASLPSQDDLKNLAHRIWMPAVAGAVGAGGLSGYLSSKADNPDETSGQRRSRILRNALAGTALGGAAGAATEEGAHALYQPFFGDVDKKPALIDRGIGAGISGAISHAGALGTLAAGGAWLGRNRKAHRDAADESIFQQLGKDVKLSAGDKLVPMDSAEHMHRFLKANPHNVEAMENKLVGTQKKNVTNPEVDLLHRQGEKAELMGGRHDARDLLNEAGFKNQKDPSKMKMLQDILFSKKTKPAEISPETAEKNFGLQNFLQQQGPVSKAVSKLVGKEPLATGLGEHAVDVGGVPELYRRLVRPSIKGRWNIPLQLALLGAGAYGANRVQKRLMGQ